MWGLHGPQETSTDDPAAIIETQEPMFYDLSSSFKPDENIFGVRVDPAYTLV